MKNLFSINNKKVLITGGSGGIGKELVNSFLDNGAFVYSLDKNISKSKFKKFNFIKFDLQNLNESTAPNLKKIIDDLNIEILINNAAVTYSNHLTEYKLTDWDKTIQINLNSIFYLSQIVSKNMVKKKIKGSIINVTSIGAKIGFPNNPAYTASKGAVSNMTKSMAVDLGTFGIRVNNLVPGYTKTKMNQKSWSNKKQNKLRANRTMLLRWALPREYVGPAIFLASQASSYVTGSDLVVDGGWINKGL